MKRIAPKKLKLLFMMNLAMPFSLAFAGVEGAIESVLKKANLQNDGVSILFRKISDGKVLFQKNETLPLNPASTIKVIVSAVSLDELGTNYRFMTKAFQSGKDLCLKGGGDPSLVQEKLMLLAEDVVRSGNKAFSGDLILDESLFKAELPYDTSFAGDSERAFVGKVSPLSVNFNSITIVGMPTELGQAARVTSDPMFDFIKIQSSAKTASTGTRADLNADIDATKNGFSATVSGRVGKNENQVAIYRTVSDPTLYTGLIFGEYFKRAGGKFQGELKKGSCAPGSKEIATLSSKPLSHIVEDLDKFSNNFIAEMLLRAISPQTTAEAGLAVIQKWLKKNKLELPSLVMENASGLSRKNRISAADLESVVRFGFNNAKFGPEFLAAMPIGATDGTMKRRLKLKPLASHVRGKSGSLSSATSLTGVLHSADYGWVSYAFIFNHQSKSNWDLIEIEDAILSLFI